MPEENFSTTYTSIRLPAPIVRTYQLVSEETNIPLTRLIEMAMKYYQPALDELREAFNKARKEDARGKTFLWRSCDFLDTAIGSRYPRGNRSTIISRFPRAFFLTTGPLSRGLLLGPK